MESAASVHHPHEQPQQPLHPSHDPSRFAFDQTQYAMPNEAWSNPSHPPASYLPSSDSNGANLPSDVQSAPAKTSSSSKQARNPTSTRLTRNRAAALAKEAGQLEQQDNSSMHQPPFPPPARHAPNYDASAYLNDDGTAPLEAGVSHSYPQPAMQIPSHPYSYPPTFPDARPATPSPSASSASTGHNQSSQGADQLNGSVQQSPLTGVYPPPGNGYGPPMLVPRVEGYPVPGMVSANMYATPGMAMGTQEMRVPSASPSVASRDLGSPPPEEYPPSLDHGPQSARSSSRPQSLENYEYTSGPISPLSAGYAPQALPSSFAAVAGGYLHGPSHSQTPTHPGVFAGADSELLMQAPAPTSGGNGGRRAGQKTKTKLTDMDRKFICVFAQNHPKARQEDIATKFAVERSTVSKILKSKEKWMKVDFFSSEARVVKHRPSKFPELEETLIHNIRLRLAARETVNDAFIKKMALELAAERGIGKDKFKASSGWVENFKHRHDLRKGSTYDKAPANGSWSSSNQPSGEANGHALSSMPPSEVHGGNVDHGGNNYNSLQYALSGTAPGDFVDNRSLGTEESNPLDEDMRAPSNMQMPPPLPKPVYAHASNRAPPGLTLAMPEGGFVSSVNSTVEQVYSATSAHSSQQLHVFSRSDDELSNISPLSESSGHQVQVLETVNTEGAPLSSPFAGHPHFYLSAPRSTSVISKSSGSSVGSIASPLSVASASLASIGSGRSHTSSSVSPPLGAYPQGFLPPSPRQGHFIPHGAGHVHRRSTSGSYTSSPLSAEVRALPGDPSSAQGSPEVPSTPARRQSITYSPTTSKRSANRRSVTFSSFSAMAAGLSLLEGGENPVPIPTHVSEGQRYSPYHPTHSRSRSHGSTSSVGRSHLSHVHQSPSVGSYSPSTSEYPLSQGSYHSANAEYSQGHDMNSSQSTVLSNDHNADAALPGMGSIIH